MNGMHSITAFWLINCFFLCVCVKNVRNSNKINNKICETNWLICFDSYARIAWATHERFVQNENEEGGQKMQTRQTESVSERQNTYKCGLTNDRYHWTARLFDYIVQVMRLNNRVIFSTKSFVGEKKQHKKQQQQKHSWKSFYSINSCSSHTW